MLADNMLRARGPEADDSAGGGRRDRQGRGREKPQEEGASETKEGSGRSVDTCHNHHAERFFTTYCFQRFHCSGHLFPDAG